MVSVNCGCDCLRWAVNCGYGCPRWAVVAVVARDGLVWMWSPAMGHGSYPVVIVHRPAISVSITWLPEMGSPQHDSASNRQQFKVSPGMVGSVLWYSKPAYEEWLNDI